jgi:hypothetical protein
MTHMATTRPSIGVHLADDAELADVIKAVNELSATLAGRLSDSPSAPLDAPHPGAAIVYSDQEYDALAARLEAPPAPNERLRRTLTDHATRGR